MWGSPISLTWAIIVGVMFFVAHMITGVIVRVVVLVLLAAFLFYLYKSEAHHLILAPGSSDLIVKGPSIKMGMFI